MAESGFAFVTLSFLTRGARSTLTFGVPPPPDGMEGADKSKSSSPGAINKPKDTALAPRYPCERISSKGCCETI